MRITDSAEAARAVLWDLDGTLADSRAYHWASWHAVMRAEGIDLTEADFLPTFGQRNDAILATWLGADVDAERVRRIGDAKESLYRELLQQNGIEPLPGAAEWVHTLHAAGWRQAIASSAPRLNVEVMRRVLGLDDLIVSFVGAEDVRRGKPDPEIFLAAAALLEVPPHRCVVVEDAPAGIDAARRAGMRSIGVGPAALTDADIVVLSLDNLPRLAFEQLLGMS